MGVLLSGKPQRDVEKVIKMAEYCRSYLRILCDLCYDDNSDLNTDPFFLVIYKSGKQTVVTPEPNSPENFIALASFDENGNFEVNSPWFAEDTPTQ